MGEGERNSRDLARAVQVKAESLDWNHLKALQKYSAWRGQFDFVWSASAAPAVGSSRSPLRRLPPSGTTFHYSPIHGNSVNRFYYFGAKALKDKQTSGMVQKKKWGKFEKR